MVQESNEKKLFVFLGFHDNFESNTAELMHAGLDRVSALTESIADDSFLLF